MRLALVPVLVPLAWSAAVAQPAESGRPVFDDHAGVRAELDRLMAARDLVAVAERFAPPRTRSLGRARVLQESLQERVAPLDNSAVMREAETAAGFRREVIAYWAGDTYAYAYLHTHARGDGIVVLDFRLTGDVREISDWW